MENGDNNDSGDDDDDDGGGSIVANYRLWDERNAETVVTLVSGSADGHWDQVGEVDFARDKKEGWQMFSFQMELKRWCFQSI